MTLTQQVTGLSERVTGLTEQVRGHTQQITALTEQVTGLREDVTGLREDVTGIREEVTGLTQRMTGLTGRFDQFEANVNARFDEQRRHFDVLAEASRDDFRNLYDLVQAHMERTDTRIDTLAVNLRTEMKRGDTALDRRVTVLERHNRSRNKRGRR